MQKQRELQWGDVVLKSDSEGKQYLEYFVERQTKTSTGENPRNKRQVKTRIRIKTKPPSPLNETPFRFTKPTKISA